jgi:hypothetical protein
MPDQPQPFPAGLDPAQQQVQDEMAEQTRRAASSGPGLGDAADVLEGVADIAGSVVAEGAVEVAATAAGAAAEVGGEVLGGAFEALGSGLEVAGGCAEGCSFVIAVVVLLGVAGAALAYAVF